MRPPLKNNNNNNNHAQCAGLRLVFIKGLLIQKKKKNSVYFLTFNDVVDLIFYFPPFLVLFCTFGFGAAPTTQTQSD